MAILIYTGELVNNIHVHIFDAKVKLHKILIGPRINAENLVILFNLFSATFNSLEANVFKLLE